MNFARYRSTALSLCLVALAPAGAFAQSDKADCADAGSAARAGLQAECGKVVSINQAVLASPGMSASDPGSKKMWMVAVELDDGKRRVFRHNEEVDLKPGDRVHVRGADVARANGK